MKSLLEIRKKKVAVFTFGRMNPPTIGHEKLIKKALEVARKQSADPYIFLSHTQDPRKNPLNNSQKIKYLKLGIPEAAKSIKQSEKIRTPFDAIHHLISLGYTTVIMVVGGDKVDDFRQTITPYVGHPDKTKRIDLESFEIIGAGARDPNAEDVSGISASKMRQFAASNNFKEFYKGSLKGLSERFARELFDLVRRGMKIAEDIIETKDSKGVTRSQMPQIARKDIKQFLAELKK